jgi:hypothetical protein
MLYIVTGLPGAGKTLNTLKEIIFNKSNFKRPLYYFNIPSNLLDIEYCKTFQAFFYSHYLNELEPLEKQLVLKKVHEIETRFKRLVQLSDFPFLQSSYTDFNWFRLWFENLYRISPPFYRSLIDEIVSDVNQNDEVLEFRHFEKYNFHWIHLEDVKKWHTLPPDSIFVCDEAQEFFPVRTKEPVPDFISAFERHRHSAYDVYLITQSANFIDVHARRLAGTHIHFYRPFNAKTTTRYEWSKVHNPDDYHDKKLAQSSRVKNDTRFYNVYRSATNHTHKVKIPKIFYLLPVLLLVLVSLGVFFYFYFFSATKAQTITRKQLSPVSAQSIESTGKAAPIVDALPYDSSIYSKIRKPVSYPKLSCFIASTDDSVISCDCYTQQFTKFNVSQNLCVSFVRNGFFDFALPDPGSLTTKSSNLSSGGVY